jgi:hypothetical protein
LKESEALNVEQRKLKVFSKERDASFARKLLAQRSKLITLDVALKQWKFLFQDQILILLVGVSGNIMKPVARGGSQGVHDGQEQLKNSAAPLWLQHGVERRITSLLQNPKRSLAVTVDAPRVNQCPSCDQAFERADKACQLSFYRGVPSVNA